MGMLVWKLGVGIGLALSLMAAVGLSGCVTRSGGTWMVSSAPLPDGWPDLTPVGSVAVRDYPAYRAATVAGADADTRPMFMELFRHIQREEIAMTAPVDMGYEAAPDDRARMTSMAFLYRTPAMGDTGEDGTVRVEDVAPRTYASVGVRGAYTSGNYRKGLRLLDSWLDGQDEWRRAGPPRYLGYNGPFVPWFIRYGEVQLPVQPR
jgi:hypothetical protein